MENISRVSSNLLNLQKELSNNKILKFDLEFSSSLEIVTSSIGTFFDQVNANKSFEVLNFFDPNLKINSSDQFIKFNDINIIKKDRYSVDEINRYLVDRPLQANQITTTSISYIQDNILNSYLNQNDIYLTFANLYYQKKNDKTIYSSPLVFFKVKITKNLEKFTLSIDYGTPLYNQILIKELKKEINIDISTTVFYLNIEEYITKISNLVKPFNFGIDKSIHLIKYDLTKYLMITDLVRYYESNFIFTNNVFNTLSGIDNNEDVNFNCKNVQFSSIQKGLNKLNSKSLVRVKYNTPLEKLFIKQAIEEHILKRQNVLYITSSTNKEDIAKKAFQNEYFDAFLAKDHPFNPSKNLYNLVKEASSTTNYLLDTKMVFDKQELEELNQEFTKIDSNIKKISLSIHQNELETFKNYFKYANAANKIFKFNNQEEYSLEKYKNDLETLKYIDTHSYFNKHNVTNQKYYLISPILNPSEFDMFISFVEKVKTKYQKIFNLVETSNISQSNFFDINSLDSIYKNLKLFSIFLEYNDFDHRYFSINFSKNIVDQIEQLIDCYRLQASINLSIDLACSPLVWNLNFEEVLSSLNNKKKEKEIIKQFKSIIKISPFKQTYKTVIILMDKYSKNIRQIGELKSSLKELFPNEIQSLDSLLQLHKAYQYLQEYTIYKNSHPSLNFDNEFINNIFSSKDYYLQFKENFELLKKSKEELNVALEKLNVLIKIDNSMIIKSNYDDVIKFLNSLLSGPKPKFVSTLKLNKLIDKSSSFLKESLIQSGPNLKNFKANYLASIYQYSILFDFNKTGGMKSVEEGYKILQEYYLKSTKDLEKIDVELFRTFDELKFSLIAAPSYNQLLKQYKQEYQASSFYSVYRGMSVLGNLYYHLAPLEVLNIKNSIYLANYKFDLAIIQYDSSFSLEEIYYACKLANKVIVIENNDDCISEQVPLLTFNLKEDLTEYNSFNQIGEIARRQINLAFKRHNIKLVKRKAISSEITLGCYFEINNQKYALNIEYNNHNLTNKQTTLITNFLYCNYKIKTTYLYLIPFLIYQDLNVSLIYSNAKIITSSEYLNNQKIRNLSYQQQQQINYFATLDNIDKSFKLYSPTERNIDNQLRRSSLQTRSIQEISYLEISNGIITYLVDFEYLSIQTLLSRLSKIVGTTTEDIDFIVLFRKACNYLKEKNKVIEKDNRLYLIR